ncbi:response regulator [Massilia sp. B-10]|nr:response regulator [Massilia sp. B-10]
MLGDEGGEIALMTFGIDVTDQRAAMAATVRAQEVAEAATRSKSEFLANMSHEIRTPMNAVIGMTRLALNTDLDPRQRNYLDKVDRAAHSLLGIINDILDFSKIEAGKLRFEERQLVLRHVLDHLAKHDRVPGPGKGPRAAVRRGPRRAAGNDGRPAAARPGAAQPGQQCDQVHRARRDHRLGAARTRQRPRAVPALRRARFGDRHCGRTCGAPVRRVLAGRRLDHPHPRRHRARTVDLAQAGRHDERPPVAGKQRAGRDHLQLHGPLWPGRRRAGRACRMRSELAALKVLVVDDNAAAREIMQGILGSLQMRTLCATSAAAAIAELEQAEAAGDPYQLVLMDWIMPTMNGLEAIRAIRANPAISRTLSIVMVTAYSRDDLLAQSGDLAQLGVLEKPVTPSSVLDAIVSGLHQGRETLPRPVPQRRLSAAMHALRGASVLLVEDNEINQELALEILTDA